MKKGRYILLALCGLMLSSAVAASQQDYCAEGDGAAVLFLVDRTSSFDDQDKQTFAEGVDTIFNHLETGDRLVIHTLTEDFSESKKIFDGCRPGCREQGLMSGLFSQCRSSVARVDERRYLREMLTSVKPMIDNEENYPRSEIIETIAFIVQEYELLKPTRLVIFSDMIEHSRLASFSYLKKDKIPGLLDKLDSLDLIKPMPGVEVDIYGFGRNHTTGRKGLSAQQKRNIEEFWRAYFERARVVNLHIGRTSFELTDPRQRIVFQFFEDTLATQLGPEDHMAVAGGDFTDDRRHLPTGNGLP